MRRAGAAGWMAAIALLLGPVAAHPASTDFELFEPSPAPQGSLLTESPQPLRGRYSVGGYLQIERDPVVVASPGASTYLQSAVHYRAQLRGLFAYSFLDRFQVGLDVPWTVLSDQDLPEQPPDPNLSHLNDIGIRLKGLAWRWRGLSLGASAILRINTGVATAFGGTDDRFMEPTLTALVEWAQDRWYVRGSVGYAERDQTRLERFGLTVDDRLQLRAGGGWEGPLDAVWFAEWNASSQIPEIFGDVRHDANELYAGVQRRFGDFVVAPAVGIGLSRAFGVPRWRLVAGLFYAPGSPTPFFSPARIGDGPTETLTVSVRDQEGRPAEGARVRWSLRGWTDRVDVGTDGEAVLPVYPGPLTVEVSGDGVVPVTRTVTVGPGGVADLDLRVRRRHPRLTAAVVDRESGEPVARGTVYIAGSDRTDPFDDGRWSGRVSAGQVRIAVVADGYYPRRREVELDWGEAASVRVELVRREGADEVVMVGDDVYIGARIPFGSDSARLLRESYPILDRLVELLEEHDEIELLRIKGYTDSQGSEAYNLDLSRERARSVRRYLIRNGIEEARLEAVGHGSAEPIASNGTASGRRQNRRVEFEIAERD